MKALPALLLAFSLTACASIPNPITQSRVDTVVASWGAALAVFNGYKEACAKRLIPSSCRTVVIKTQAVIPTVRAKVNSARDFASKPTLSTLDLVGIAETAVGDFERLQADLGVK